MKLDCQVDVTYFLSRLFARTSSYLSKFIQVYAEEAILTSIIRNSYYCYCHCYSVIKKGTLPNRKHRIFGEIPDSNGPPPLFRENVLQFFPGIYYKFAMKVTSYMLGSRGMSVQWAQKDFTPKNTPLKNIRNGKG